MSTIWKYPLEITDRQALSLPVGADILSVGNQNGTLMLWALVDPNNGVSARKIHIFGTGHQIGAYPGKLRFIGTAFTGSLVWHVFEETTA